MGLKEFVLLLKRSFPADQSLVEAGIAVLHSFPFMAFDGRVELFVGVVQFGGSVSHSCKSRAEVIEIISQLFGLLNKSGYTKLLGAQWLTDFDKFI